jgi:hypothetical protein
MGATFQHKPLPFRMEGNQKVKMPNGQTVTKEEVRILIGMLNAERKGQKNTQGESAEAIAKRLLKSKAKIETLTDKLKELL